MKFSLAFYAALSIFLFTPTVSSAQSAPMLNDASQPSYSLFKLSPDISNKGFFSKDAEWFFSLGFNKTYYATSNINVSQPSLGNNFTVNDVQAHDEYRTPGLRSPDNIRVGRFINDEKTWAVDLSLDHDKYTTTLGQTALVTGTNNGSLGLGNQQLNSSTFSYMLHNGLNHLMVDLMYRQALIGAVNEPSSLSFIGKIGTGPAIVHAYNQINGVQNDEGVKDFSHVLGFNSGWWRIVGLSTGIETGVRYNFTKPLYVELTDKSIYTMVRNIPVNQGTATQNILSNEIILSIGYTMN